MDDPEVAEQILSQEDEQPKDDWHPSLAEYGLTEQLLTQIVDGIHSLQAVVVGASGGKPERPKPFPRPRTQVDVIRERRSQETQAEIISLFAPHVAR